jgi:predicted secreted protein
MAGFSALGTKFAMSTASSQTGGPESTGSTSSFNSTDWQDFVIADLTNISGPTMSAEEIDVSSHDSTGYFREFVAGFLDGGEISLEGNLTVGGGTTDLNVAFGDRLTRSMVVVFPATGTATGSTAAWLGHWFKWMFEGTVTGLETAAPYDDKASFSASVRITGQPHLISGSGTSTAA